MSERYRILALMTAAQLGMSVIQQGVGVLAPWFIAEYAISKTQLGSLFTAIFVGSASCTAVAGVFTDRLGERRMLAFSGMLMTAALVMAAVVNSFPWLVVSMACFGVSYAASSPAGSRAILTWFDTQRGFAMGLRQTGVPLGGLVGALVLPFVAFHAGGYRPAMLVAAALVALPTIAAVALYHEPATEHPRVRQTVGDIVRGMPALARDPRLITVTCTACILVSTQQAMNGFLTLKNIQIVGLSPALASIAFAAAQASATFGRLFWGWFSDRFLGGERINLMGGLSLLAAAGTLSVGLMRPGLGALAIPIAMLLGFGAAGWNGLQVAALGEISGSERAGAGMGISLTMIFLASGLAPLAFGFVADHTSLDTAWYAWTFVALCGMLPVLLLRRAERARARAGRAI